MMTLDHPGADMYGPVHKVDLGDPCEFVPGDLHIVQIWTGGVLLAAVQFRSHFCFDDGSALVGASAWVGDDPDEPNDPSQPEPGYEPTSGLSSLRRTPPVNEPRIDLQRERELDAAVTRARLGLPPDDDAGPWIVSRCAGATSSPAVLATRSGRCGSSTSAISPALRPFRPATA